MRYWLRNDDEFTVTVEYVHAYNTYLCEVYFGLERIIHHESESAGACLDVAKRFVDEHVSSQYLWALNEDSNHPAPRVRPKSPEYTKKCRKKVEKLYGKRK